MSPFENIYPFLLAGIVFEFLLPITASMLSALWKAREVNELDKVLVSIPIVLMMTACVVAGVSIIESVPVWAAG